MRSIFAVLFIILRLIIWPFYCYPFWIRSAQLIMLHFGVKDVHTPVANLLFNGAVTPLSPSVTSCHSVVVVTFFVFANVLLTALQYYWGITIFGFLFTKPKKGGKVKEKKGSKAE